MSYIFCGTDTSDMGEVHEILPYINWMIYRGPGFLAVVGFGSSPTHYPLSVSQLD
jgi:hypothetical protein